MNTAEEQRYSNLLRELETLVGRELADLAAQSLSTIKPPTAQHIPICVQGPAWLPAWRIARAVDELQALSTNMRAAVAESDPCAWLRCHGLPNPNRPDPLFAWFAMIPSRISVSPKQILADIENTLMGMLSKNGSDMVSGSMSSFSATIQLAARYLRTRQAQRVWQQATLVTAQRLFADALERLDDRQPRRLNDMCALFPLWSRCQALAVQRTAVPHTPSTESGTRHATHNTVQPQSDFLQSEVVQTVSDGACSLKPPPAEALTLPARFHECLASLLNRMAAAATITPVTTPRRAYWREDGAALYRYGTPARDGEAPSLLIVSGWRHRSEVLDLDPDLSLVNAFRAHGVDVWVLEWPDPALSLRPRTLEHCLSAILSPAITCVAEIAGASPALLGVAETGILTLSQASLQSNALSGVIVEGGGLGLDPTWSALIRWLPLDEGSTPVSYLSGAFLGALEHSLLGCGQELSPVIARLMATERDGSAPSFARAVFWMLDRSNLDPHLLREYRDAFVPPHGIAHKPVVVGATRINPFVLRTPVLNLTGAASEGGRVEPPDWQIEGKTSTYRELSIPSGGLEAVVMSTAPVRNRVARAIADWLWLRKPCPTAGHS